MGDVWASSPQSQAAETKLLVGVEGRAVLFHRPAAPLRHRRGRGGATEDLNLATGDVRLSDACHSLGFVQLQFSLVKSSCFRWSF